MWPCNFKKLNGRGSTSHCPPKDDEFQVMLDKGGCGFFNITPTRYQYVDGVFGAWAGWVAEQAEAARNAAFDSLKARIVDKRREKNNVDFAYQGVQYVSDEPNILGVKSQIEKLADDAAIPTFTGTALASTWASAEGTFTPFNCGEFRTFASFYYSHREKNFTNYTLLTIAATQAFAGGATIEELEAFDISQGWD